MTYPQQTISDVSVALRPAVFNIGPAFEAAYTDNSTVTVGGGGKGEGAFDPGGTFQGAAF